MVHEALRQYHSQYKRIMFDFLLGGEESVSGRILDVGCGRGEDIKKILMRRGELYVTGIDISFDRLAEASVMVRKNGLRAHFVQARGESLPFPEGSFDAIIASEVIEHTRYAERFVRNIHSALRGNGICVITTPSRFNYTTLLGALVPVPLKNRLRKFVYTVRNETGRPHVKEYTPGELTRLFKTSGFTVERVKGGVMRVPSLSLFSRYPFLIRIWSFIDKLAGLLPGGINLKHNVVLKARKRNK